MHLPPITTPLTLLLLSSLPPITTAAKPPSAILLSQVRSLTLKSTSLTTARRVSPIPQLKCTSPRALCSLPEVSSITTMRCTNTGSSYTSEDIEWSCTASLPSTLRLDRTEVICEGYDSPDDPYILKGSCGVEYTLALTDEGRERYPNLVKGGWGKTKGNWGEEETDWSGVLFGILFVGVLVWILVGACTSWGQNNNNNTTGQRRQPRTGGGGGWGGGGGNDDDDPPPPYPGTGGSNNTRRPKTTTSSSSSSRQSQEQGWRPGFWTGLASGAAGGYMAGQRRSNTSTFGGYNAYDNDTYSSRWGGSNRFGGGSGWAGAGPSRSSSRESGPSHESTGYGSTSRR